jgi:hypothetical protein
LHGFGDGSGGRKGKEDVNVIGDAADGERFHVIFGGDTAEVRPEAGFERRSDERAAVPGAEDAMEV